jgi:hypothetical protein
MSPIVVMLLERGLGGVAFHSIRNTTDPCVRFAAIGRAFTAARIAHVRVLPDVV